jgi:hypothetical protein
MVQVTLYRNLVQQYDILILDCQQYLAPVAFDAVVEYLKTHLSTSIQDVFPTEQNHISPCLKYNGIAIQLKGQLFYRKNIKQEIETILQEALDTLLT